jgi:hypothetical protein
MFGLSLAFLVAPWLEAANIYTYTGHDFTVVNGPYTTSDFESVSVTLSSPLAYNSGLTGYTPTAFSFSDGVQTLTNFTPNMDAEGFFLRPPMG